MWIQLTSCSCCCGLVGLHVLEQIHTRYMIFHCLWLVLLALLQRAVARTELCSLLLFTLHTAGQTFTECTYDAVAGDNLLKA